MFKDTKKFQKKTPKEKSFFLNEVYNICQVLFGTLGYYLAFKIQAASKMFFKFWDTKPTINLFNKLE